MSPTRRKKTTQAPVPESDPASLREEIRLLRELLHRTAGADIPPEAAAAQIRMLDSVGRACGHLARLVRAQASLGGQDELAEEISRIADEIREQVTGMEAR